MPYTPKTPLKPKQRAMFAAILQHGQTGATFKQIGRNVKTLPSLIFRGLVEHVTGSEPWRYRVKGEADALCPGCDVLVSIANAGGYRTYCQKCADAIPEIPAHVPNKAGWRVIGRFPSFVWVKVRE